MRATGIVVEYNPFHNGHYYHLQQSKKQTEADCIIAVMSGHFLQRGEPALVSKWARTRMALQHGADLVIELPYAFSTQQADIFASGAVSILEALHAHSLCFGSEDGNTNLFTQTAAFLRENAEQLSLHIKKEMSEGKSYPKAASLAFQTIATNHQVLDVSQPNNILGLSYVKAIQNQHASIKPHTIARIQSHYHDLTLPASSIASATSIRKALAETQNEIEQVEQYVPEGTLDILRHYLETYKSFHQWEKYFSLLKYKLLTMTPQSLEEIYEVEEGIQYRLLHYIKGASSFHEFIQKVKNKRYTWTRLQRICVHILTNTTKGQMAFTLQSPISPYARLLGMSDTGRTYLKQIKKKLHMPVVSTVSQCSLDCIELDIKATNIYSMSHHEPVRSQLMLKEYNTPPIIYSP